jgi:hypothetical protein
VPVAVPAAALAFFMQSSLALTSVNLLQSAAGSVPVVSGFAAAGFSTAGALSAANAGAENTSAEPISAAVATIDFIVMEILLVDPGHGVWSRGPCVIGAKIGDNARRGDHDILAARGDAEPLRFEHKKSPVLRALRGMLSSRLR